MKTLACFTVAVLLCAAAHAREVTLTINPSGGSPAPAPVEVSIGTNEVAQVTCAIGFPSIFGSPSGLLIKDGSTNSLLPRAAPEWSANNPIRFAGPATFRLTPGTQWGLVTLKIEPESFPPDKAIIIPQGTPGANIIMEASGDLVHWTNAPPGLYTNTEPSHLFFRLRAERLP
jgi:hypothetical protein